VWRSLLQNFEISRLSFYIVNHDFKIDCEDIAAVLPFLHLSHSQVLMISYYFQNLFLMMFNGIQQVHQQPLEYPLNNINIMEYHIFDNDIGYSQYTVHH
jgi:hypothetical protein